MARGPVWIEAYEQYLLRKNVCEEATFDWVQKYCRQYM